MFGFCATFQSDLGNMVHLTKTTSNEVLRLVLPLILFIYLKEAGVCDICVWLRMTWLHGGSCYCSVALWAVLGISSSRPGCPPGSLSWTYDLGSID